MATTTASQPIALPTACDADAIMASGSYSANGSFNPASYQRHFLGSPLSWRADSFGSRYISAGSPTAAIPGFDADHKSPVMSTSFESDKAAARNALVCAETNEFSRDFTCCGTNLTDLHALLAHVDEHHFRHPSFALNACDWTLPTASSSTSPSQALAGFSYDRQDPGSSQTPGVAPPPLSGRPEPVVAAPLHPAPYNPGPFDPDDMELDDHSPPSSGASTPPDTPISTPLSAYPSPRLPASLSFASHGWASHPNSLPSSACPSPRTAAATLMNNRGRSTYSSHNLDDALLSRRHNSYSPLPATSRSSALAQSGMEDAFNPLRRYSEFAMNGNPLTALPTEHTDRHSPVEGVSRAGSSEPGCVPPSMLHSNASTPAGTPYGSRVASPAPHGTTFYPLSAAPTSAEHHPKLHTSALKATSSKSMLTASTTLSRPASSLLLSKPFKCPKPNCNKSYKQANGLKYHLTHGSCNFAPPKDLEQVQALLASKLASKGLPAPAAGSGSDGLEGEGLSEGELREVEKEAERRLRPFACGIGDCQRRYKNMNGLRYHYQHSGDHGAIGLGLLASGQHESIRNHANKAHSSASRSSVTRPSSHSPTPSPISPTESTAAAFPAPSYGAAQLTHFQQYAAQNPALQQQLAQDMRLQQLAQQANMAPPSPPAPQQSTSSFSSLAGAVGGSLSAAAVSPNGDWMGVGPGSGPAARK